MNQSDSDLMESLAVARQELAARLKDRCSDPQLWNATVSKAVTTLSTAKDRLGSLFAKESESNRKLSDAEYKQREVHGWEQVKAGIEKRLELLVRQAADDRIANAKSAAELFESVEIERARLQEYESRLTDRREALGRREQELFKLSESVAEDARRATAHRRHAEDYHQQLLALQKELDEQRIQLEQRIADTKSELGRQQKLTSEIERNAQGYRDNLKEAEKSKRKADELMIAQADALGKLNQRIADYENKEYLLKKREGFVMKKWDETCRQVAHLRLPIDLQGMPTP